MLKLLKDPSKWDEAREALKSPPLAPADFKTCFRTYSDADPEQHLAFDLYRIQAQEALKVIGIATITTITIIAIIVMVLVVMIIVIVSRVVGGHLFCFFRRRNDGVGAGFLCVPLGIVSSRAVLPQLQLLLLLYYCVQLWF